jgi:hypothetical protein
VLLEPHENPQNRRPIGGIHILTELTVISNLEAARPGVIEASGPTGSVALAHRRAGGEGAGMMPRRPCPIPAFPSSAFKGFRFPAEVIVLAVRWYFRYGLSYRDVEELLAERGIEVDRVTIYRWVQRFTPLLANAARPCRHTVGDRWYVDETYVKVAGRWRDVHRAIASTVRSSTSLSPRDAIRKRRGGSSRRHSVRTARPSRS